VRRIPLRLALVGWVMVIAMLLSSLALLVAMASALAVHAQLNRPTGR